MSIKLLYRTKLLWWKRSVLILLQTGWGPWCAEATGWGNSAEVTEMGVQGYGGFTLGLRWEVIFSALTSMDTVGIMCYLLASPSPSVLASKLEAMVKVQKGARLSWSSKATGCAVNHVTLLVADCTLSRNGLKCRGCLFLKY